MARRAAVKVVEPESGAERGVEKDVLAAGRAACYKARDAFYACLEADAGHSTPTEIASVGLLYPAQCKAARTTYVQNCRTTWVKHFDRRFCGKKRLTRLLDSNRSTPITLPAQTSTFTQ